MAAVKTAGVQEQRQSFASLSNDPLEITGAGLESVKLVRNMNRVANLASHFGRQDLVVQAVREAVETEIRPFVEAVILTRATNLVATNKEEFISELTLMSMESIRFRQIKL